MPRSPKRAKGERPAATDPGPRSLFKAFRHVKASEIERNPKNWRVHPTFQREALKGVLQEHGFAGAVLCYEPEPGKLRLIDGEARLDSLPPDYEVPVIVIEADEKTADALLATWDPLSALAADDSEKLEALLDAVGSKDGALGTLLQELRQREGLDVEERLAAWSGMPAYEHEDLEPWKQVIVNFKSPEDYAAFVKAIGQPDLSEEARSIWYPKAPVGHVTDKRYVGGLKG